MRMTDFKKLEDTGMSGQDLGGGNDYRRSLVA